MVSANRRVHSSNASRRSIRFFASRLAPKKYGNPRMPATVSAAATGHPDTNQTATPATTATLILVSRERDEDKAPLVRTRESRDLNGDSDGARP